MRTASLSLLCVVVVAGPAVRADIAPSPVAAGTGPTLRARNGTDARGVRMAGEHVVLTLENAKEGAFVVVDATFRMQAPQRTTLEIAFPGQGVPVGGGRAHPRLHGFRAFIDEKPVATEAKEHTTRTKAGPPGRETTRSRTEVWHTFPAVVDDATTIRVRYAIEAEPVVSPDEPPRVFARAGYVLHTGAAWAGAIGDVIVEVRAVGVDLAQTSVRTLAMPEPSLVSLHGGTPAPVTPANATRSAAAITLRWSDLEPGVDDDLEMVWPATGVEGGDGQALVRILEAAARR